MKFSQLALIVLAFTPGCDESTPPQALQPARIATVAEPSKTEPGLVSSAAPSERTAAVVPESTESTPLAVQLEVTRMGEDRKLVGVPDVALKAELVLQAGKKPRWSRTLESIAPMEGDYRSDAEGRCLLSFEVPAAAWKRPADGQFLALAVTPRAEGYQARSHIVPLDRKLPLKESELKLRPGGTIWGRVLDQEGQPLPSSEVRLTKSGGPTAGQSQSRVDGSFTVHYRFCADPAVLTASWVGHGSTRLDGLDISPGSVYREDEPIELQLASEASIRGIVRDEKGAPCTGLPLVCALEGSADDRDSYGRTIFRNLTQARAMTDRGFVAASTWTGADGSFEFTGLARGRYVVRAAAVSTEVFDQVISTPSVEAPAENVELRVSVQRVLVRLLDDKGVPLSFQPDDVTLKAEGAGTWRQSAQPRVVCRKSNGEGRAIDFIPKSCWLTGPSSREWMISLKPGAHYLLHAWCAGRGMLEKEFFVGEGRTPRAIDLHLGPKQAGGHVLFELEYPEGPNRVDKVLFNLFAAGSEVHLAEGRGPSGSLSLHLAPGSYRVNLQGSSDSFSWGSCQVVLDDDDFETQSRYRISLPAPFNQTVQVEPGKETSLSRRFEGRGGLQVDIAELEGKPKVQLATRRLGDLEWQPLIFSKRFAIMRHGAASESKEKDPDDWIRAGMSRRPDESFPVGRWEIRGRVRGYLDQVEEFSVEHGKLSTVQLRF